MNILLTNDDGYEAPGLLAAWNAVRELGSIFVAAPSTECSTCSHRITLGRSFKVRKCLYPPYERVFAVDGTPADCVRLAVSGLIDEPIDLVISGVNRGANAGVDVFYSGTVAGAREAAIMGIRGIAFSHAVRGGVEANWPAVTSVVGPLARQLAAEVLPSPGFWSVNLPAPISDDALSRVHRVALEPSPPPLRFDRVPGDGPESWEYRDAGAYWSRPGNGMTDYSIIREGGIAITAVPLFGDFPNAR